MTRVDHIMIVDSMTRVAHIMDTCVGRKVESSRPPRTGGDRPRHDATGGGGDDGGGAGDVEVMRGDAGGGGGDSISDGDGSIRDGENVSSRHPCKTFSSMIAACRANPYLNQKLNDRNCHMRYANIEVLQDALQRVKFNHTGKRKADGSPAPVDRKYGFLGRGGYGFAWLVQSAQKGKGQGSVYKLEFINARTRPENSALCREFNLYSSVSGSSADQQCPLPKLSNTLDGHPFVTIALSSETTVRILDMEYLSDWPHQVLANSAKNFQVEYRADAKGRYLILQILGALLWLESKGIKHNDLKPEHIYSRPGNFPGQYHVVFIDYGLAHNPQLTYESSVAAQGDGRQVQQQTGTISYESPVFSASKPIRILGAPDGRPGTRGFRPPIMPAHDPGPDNPNLKQFGMILLSII